MQYGVDHMKAKEYAKIFEASEKTGKDILEIWKSMFEEMADLQKSRNAVSDQACLSIYTETKLKWKAFANLCPGVAEDGFEKGMKIICPDFLESLQEVEANADLDSKLRRMYK